MSPRAIEFPVAGLSDGVVTVRLVAESDVAAITAACQDAAIARYTTIPSPYRERHARQWLTASAAGMAAGTDLGAVVVDAATGGLVGSVGIHGIDPATGRCAAGYWVAAPARGRGVAARALRLLAGYAFEELDVARIEVWIEPENSASRAVADAVGFHREGVLRSFMPIEGERRNMLMYSLLPADLHGPPDPGRDGYAHGA